MPDYTVTLSGDREAAVSAAAAAAGQTKAEYVQERADREADNARLVQLNDWWSGLDLAAKIAAFNAATA